MAEVDSDNVHKDNSSKFYEEALTLAGKLQKNDKTYLGLALNYSVFLYNTKGDKSKAISFANETKA